jgi:hypothetical protein
VQRLCGAAGFGDGSVVHLGAIEVADQKIRIDVCGVVGAEEEHIITLRHRH